MFNAPLFVCPQSVTLYGSSMLGGSVPAGQPLAIEGASQPGLVTKNGLVLYGTDGKPVSAVGFISNAACGGLSPLFLCFINFVFDPQLLVKNLQFEDGKMIPASKYFSSGESSSVELTEDEKKMAAEIRASQRPADSS